MALDMINIGNAVNDGTGDDLRTAFTKVNQNFEDLELRQGQNNTASNSGTGRPIFKEKIGVDLRFRSVVGGTGITITQNPNDLTITNNISSIGSITTDDSNTITPTIGGQPINILGGTGITTVIYGNTLTIHGNNYKLEYDPAPKLGANLNLNGKNIYGTGSISATSLSGALTGSLTGNSQGVHTGNVVGNVTGLVYGIDVRKLDQDINSFDLGPIFGSVSNFTQWFNLTNDIDLGTFVSPSSNILDMGTIV